MRLPARYHNEILAHALEGRPNEICGLIAGKDGRAVKIWRTTNNDPNPRVRYNVEPLELLSILREIEDKGWNLAAIYHSHPATEAYPSATDIGLAYYPQTVYIIVSLARKDEPVVRAFRIVDHEVVEEPLVITEDDDDSLPPAIAAGGEAPTAGTETRKQKTRGSSAAGGLFAVVLRRLRRRPAEPNSETQQGEGTG